SLTKGYLRDVRTGVNTLVTGPENQPGVLANDSMRTHDLVMSGDGRWIVFGSMATNLIPGFVQHNGTQSDLYLYEVATGDLTLISHSTAGALDGGNGQSDTASISHDGRYVLYGSTSTNLVSGFVDNNAGEYDIYVFDRTTGTNRLVTRTAGSATTGL